MSSTQKTLDENKKRNAKQNMKMMYVCVTHIHTYITKTNISAIIHTHSLEVPGNRETLRTLLRYSVLMVCLPVMAFFVTRKMYEDSDRKDMISMGVSVVVTNLIIISYTIMAFTEPSEEEEKKSK